MVGTTRFELATSPSPRVRSTRLSHVPTVLHPSAQGGQRRGYPACPSVHEASPLRRPRTHAVPSPKSLLRGGYILLRQRSALPIEELVHLLHQELLRLPRPRLQTVLVQQHLLPLDPLTPGLLAHALVNLLAKVRVERRLIQPFHLSLVLHTKNHVRHRVFLLFPPL